MEGKKKFIIAIILFIFLGLTVFTFANPGEEDTLDGSSKNNTLEAGKDETEKDNGDEETVISDNDNTNSGTLNESTNASTTRGNTSTNNTTTVTVNVANIDDSYDKAKEAVEKAENEVTTDSYNAALELVDKVTNESQKEELNERLEEVKNGIDVQALVATLESKVNSAEDLKEMNSARDYEADEEVREKVAALSNETLKTSLQERLNTLAKLLNDTSAATINIEDEAVLNYAKLEILDDNSFTATLKNLTTLEEKEVTSGEEITEDGEYELTVVDAAFNSITITFTIDTKLMYTDLGILSKNDNHEYAKVGDTVRVFVYFEEELAIAPKVSINTVVDLQTKYSPNFTTSGKYAYVVDYKIKEEDNFEDGELQIKVYGYEDIATNKGEELTNEDINYTKYSKVIYDNTLSSAKIGGSTGEKYWYPAQTFDVIITEENLDSVYYIWNQSANDKNMKTALDSSNAIKVDINDLKVNEDGTYTLTISENVKNGSYVFNIKMTDKAGNVKYQRKGWYNFDNVNPVITEVKEGGIYKEVTPVITDNNIKTIKLNGVDYVSGKTIKTEGEYELVATDKAGNSASVKFEIDRTKPRITGVEDGAYYNTDVTLVVEDKNFKNATVKLNGKKISYNRGDVLTKEGTYTIVATDLAMNKTKTITFTIDKTMVNVVSESQVYEAKEGGRIKTTVVFSETVKYPFDNLNWRKVSETEYYTYFYRTKDYTIKFADLAGNENTYTIKIDKTAPILSVKDDYVGDKDTNVYSNVSFKLYDSLSGIKKALVNGKELTYSVNTYGDMNYQNIVSYLVEGENTIILYDAVGNPSEAFTFTYDKTAPVLFVKDGYVGDIDKNIYSNVSFKLYDALSGIKKALVNGKELTYSVSKYGDMNYQNIVGYLVEGENTIVLYDLAGNASKEFTFTYDKTAPSISYSLVPDGVTRGPVTVTLVANEDIRDLDGWTKVDSKTFTKVYEENAKEYIDVYDLAGNKKNVFVEVKRIDKINPTFVGIENNAIYNHDVTYKVSKTGDTTNVDFAIVENSIREIIIDGVSYSEKAAPRTISAEGKHTIKVVDKAGNESEVITFVIDKTPGTLSVKDGYVGDKERRIFSNVSFKLYDGLSGIKRALVNGKEFTYSVNTYGDMNYGNIASSLVEGENTVVLYDAAGNASEAYTFTYDKTAPQPHSTTYSTSQITKDPVTVTIRVNEELREVDGWTLSEDKKAISKTFSENINGNVTISDIAGNKKTRYYSIKNIDTSAPTYEILVDGEKVEVNNGDTVEFTNKVELIVKDKALDNVKIINVANPKDLTGLTEWKETIYYAGTPKYTVTDKAGNVTNIEFILIKK